MSRVLFWWSNLGFYELFLKYVRSVRMIPTRRKSADVKSTFIQSKILETFEPDTCGRLQLESGCISTDMWQLYDRLSGLETHVSWILGWMACLNCAWSWWWVYIHDCFSCMSFCCPLMDWCLGGLRGEPGLSLRCLLDVRRIKQDGEWMDYLGSWIDNSCYSFAVQLLPNTIPTLKTEYS